MVEEKEEAKEESKKKVNLKIVKKKEDTKEEEGFDLGKLLNDPVVASLLEGGKELFKKEKTDPDVCEISIKAPSAVVLKLFHVKEE